MIRRFIIGTLLAGALLCPGEAAAFDCGGPLSWSYRALDDGISEEKRRRDIEARKALDVLEQTPILFRGRIASARNLSDPGRTNTPVSLLVFDNVEIIKGTLATTAAGRRTFILRQEWCDVRCRDDLARHWVRGDTIIVGVHPTHRANLIAAKQAGYRGRIDASLSMCSVGRLSPVALQLIDAPEEVNRLKREYQRVIQ